MHIPESVLSPAVVTTTAVLGAAGFGYAMRCLGEGLRDRATVLMGMMSAFIFAAQMVNFPVFPGVSGHLLGGVLAAVLLGPWAGAGVIGAVLIVQCLLFADGGLSALGANFVNMGLIGAVVGYVVYAPIRRAIGGRSGVLLGAMAAAWFTVILAAGAFAVELAASGEWDSFFPVLGWMTLVHSAIGLGEAVITGLALQFVLRARPDLIYNPDDLVPALSGRWGQVAAAGLAVSLAVASFVAPIASESPDGLEFVGAKLRFLTAESDPLIISPMPDYGLPGLPDLKVVTAAVGIIGTLAVFAIGLALGRVFARMDEPHGVKPAAAPALSGKVGSDAA